MLSASIGFAVPEKILNRSSFKTLALRVTTQQPHHPASATEPERSSTTGWTRRDAEAESTTHRQIILRCASNERTSRERQSRKRRAGRAETQQRLAAPSPGSGNLQTPPNRDPPPRLLAPLLVANPAAR